MRQCVFRLGDFPFAGAVVSELRQESIREIFHGEYRIIYSVANGRVEILAINHGARMVDELE